MHDTLTRLGNRALFDATLARILPVALREGHKIAVLYIDLDGFKQVNDTLGHLAGDELLIGVADRLRESVRERDEAFRLGGDEFAVILHALTGPEQVDRVRARIAEAMDRPIALTDGSLVPVSISIGMAIFPDHGASAEALLRQADEAMYQDKSNRRNHERQDPSNP